MEFTLYGFDVYGTEVDDKGIDFVIRNDANSYFDVQVKSLRSLNYVFVEKAKFQLESNMLLALVLFMLDDAPPRQYLIPAAAWSQPNSLFVGHDYEGKKSKPEWGLNLSRRNLPYVEPYAFEQVVERLRSPGQ
jgi:hypothetical protein